jgi:hypothetical protein
MPPSYAGCLFLVCAKTDTPQIPEIVSLFCGSFNRTTHFPFLISCDGQRGKKGLKCVDHRGQEEARVKPSKRGFAEGLA